MVGERVSRSGLQVDSGLAAFIENEALPGTGVEAAAFWQGLAGLIADFGPVNRGLLETRANLQARIDAWHRENAGRPQDHAAYQTFLTGIGYLLPEGPDFVIGTENTDPEIATIAGPQLVVPVMNARFALNAANARWGSLYDALYGTDALGPLPASKGFDRERGQRAVAWARDFLDVSAPIEGASWHDITGWLRRESRLFFRIGDQEHGLRDPAQFVGYDGDPAEPFEIVIARNGLRLGIVADRSSDLGRTDRAGISEIWVEAAISAIMDLEDSIAAVDGADKATAYRNWLGLMKGDLTETFTKNGAVMTRELDPDHTISAPDGAPLVVKGRALMLVRNVGHLMTTPAVLEAAGNEIPEGLLDALVTVLCAMHDLKKTSGPRNSDCGSVYVVKPKMHGPEEVAFACAVFDRVEDILGLPRHTVKLGIMDEERRTSVNLKECIRVARHRLAFINTGFLDRTGDEIHTSMEAGPMVRKADMKVQAWISAYEDRNVDIGLACGLPGRAQIGKGMWAAPDLMAGMLKDKIGHPLAGANCAWVPSPTAATLHATHYHRVDVTARQREIAAQRRPERLDDLLTIPLARGQNWSAAEIAAEVDNNAQGILGYVVRWVDQGIGCSKVPDIHDVALMEDRATCRISSQHLANWLRHGVISRAEIEAAFRRMAVVVDGQNAGDPFYRPMAPACDGLAFTAALALAVEGVEQPSGYTEPILHAARLRAKAAG